MNVIVNQTLEIQQN